jgi:DNA primase
MARIPDEEIERLKREISLERLAEARGVELRRHGANLLGLCPFHDDREPSLVITPEKNLWHCLGACQTGGTVIDWVMKAEGVTFRHAVELLKADLPFLGAERPARSKPRAGGKVVKASTVQKLPAVFAENASDAELLEQVVDYYHATLKESREALAYLEKRGLRSPEMIERFRLGYANRTLAYRLPRKNRVAGAEIRGELQRLGVLRKSGHEHLNGSLVIPVFDLEGRVTEMYGRKILSNLRPGTPQHLYLPGPHRGVWNIEAVRDSKEIILCEALIDALTFWCAGYRNVTSCYGAEGFTGDHVEAFRKYGTERVYIAFDRDAAGDRSAEKLGAELSAMGIEVLRVVFPRGMDANEYALKVGPADKSFGLVIRQAEWMHRGAAQAGSTARPTPAEPMPAESKPALARTPAIAERTTSPPEPNEPATETTSSPEPEALPSPPAPEEPSLLPESLPAALAARPSAAEIFSLAAELGDAVATPAASLPSSEANSVLPAGPVSAEAGELVLSFGDRRWRVRGLDKNATLASLKVNLLVSREGGGFHVDTLELYSARQRAAFTKQASEELGVEEQVVKRELGQVLLRVEEEQEKQQRAAKEPEKKRAELGAAERAAALDLLRSPELFERILSDFERAGVVGEHTNKLVGYLAATSRKLDEPLAVVIQSSSAAGKSSLMDAILSLMPEEERVTYSAMTGQSLFYMGDQDLRHKILAIVEEEGAERASYALKLLQSEGELTIASTGKDPATGRLVTQEYRVEGPVMIFLTTTAIEIDEELLNRCLVLTVDEGREQTRAIHERQRRAETLAGLLEEQEREKILKVHRDAQRLIRPLFVVNPYAEELRFSDAQTRTRRDHKKYLALIRTIALLHQYQREVKTVVHGGEELCYIEATREDILRANHLAHEVLGRSLDELPPQTRRLLGLLDEMVRGACERLGLDRGDFRFSRREVREKTGWGNTQLKVHLRRLEELEYLAVHRAGRGQGFLYELAYDGGGKDGRAHLSGLLHVEIEREYDGERSGQNGGWSGPGRSEVGPESGVGRGSEEGTEEQENGSNRAEAALESETTRRGPRANGASYAAVGASARAAALAATG